MDKLDHFAGLAIQALVASKVEPDERKVAKAAYVIAQAMLDERIKLEKYKH